MTPGQKRWTTRPPGSNWGEFGADDELGRLNLITPEVRKRAAAEVREGLTFCLSLPLDCPRHVVLNPRRFAPAMGFSMRGEDPAFNYPMDRVAPGQTDVVCDDRATLSLQYSTQWDSLAHIGALYDAHGSGERKVTYYNGYAALTDVRGPYDYLNNRTAIPPPHGAMALGIDVLAQSGLQSRGVLVDLFAHFGLKRRAIGYEEVMRVLSEDRIEVSPGDILCLRTGFDNALLARYADASAPFDPHECSGLDGFDSKLLNWLSDSGVAALVSDNEAVEILPQAAPSTGTRIPLHEHCLFKLGMPLGELFLLSPLADWLRSHDRFYFQLTAPPLRLPGAVGSPVTPVAAV